MEHKKKLYLAIGITIIITLAFAGVVIKMLIENGKCVDHPFEYSAERLEKSGGRYSCYCDSLDPELLDFTFDKNGITIEEPIIFKPLTEHEIENLIIK